MHAMKVRAILDNNREVDGLLEVNLTNSYVLDGLHINLISNYESGKILRSGNSERPKKDTYKSLIGIC